MGLHAQYVKEHEHSEKMVVFLHGILGSPDQFKDLRDAVFTHGYSVSSILLPGHGGSGEEFARKGRKDWEEHVKRVLTDYSERYKCIFLIGHSLGGLLALNASTLYSCVKGIVLLAAPLHIKLCPRGMINALKAASHNPKHDNEISVAYRSAYGITKTRLLTYPLWIPRFIDLFLLIRKTKNILERVTVPVLIFQSKNDESVQYKSGANLQKSLIHAQTELIELKKSWHAFYPNDEREIVRKEILSFLCERTVSY